MKNKNLQTTNDKRLLEFIKDWPLKEWKRVRSLGNSGYVIRLREMSETCLDLLIDSHPKIKRKTELNQETFMKINPIKLSKNDWYQFTYEVLKLCNSHVNYSLLDKDSNISSDIGIQYYFLNKSMWENYKHTNERNQKSIYIEYKSDRSLQGALISNYEELLHYDVRDKESRQDLNDFKNWMVGNELAYHESKLKMLCAILNRSSYKKVLNEGFIDKDYLKDIPKTIQDHPQIQLYSMAFVLHQTKSDVDFKKLLKTLDHELALNQSLSPNYLEPLYYQLLNFSIHQILIGKSEYLKEYLDISNKLLQNGLLLEQGHISGSHFKNICNAHIQRFEYEEADSFINQYGKKLLDKEKSLFYKYSKGLLHYYQNEHNECLNLLRSVDHNIKTDDFVKVDIKILMVLACMQIDQHHEFEHEIRNVKLMFPRKGKKISEKFIAIWETTTRFLKEIYAVPKHKMDEEFPILIQKVEGNPLVKNAYLIIRYMRERI